MDIVQKEVRRTKLNRDKIAITHFWSRFGLTMGSRTQFWRTFFGGML